MGEVASPERVYAESSSSRLPGVYPAFVTEVAKLGAQLPVRLVFLACVGAPVVFGLVIRETTVVPADTLFGRWSATTGFATSLTVLGFASAWGLPLVAGVLSGDTFASEDRLGTWKTVLTRSCSRSQLFVAKVAAAGATTMAAVVALAVSSLVSGIVLVGSSPLIDLSGGSLGSATASERVLLAWVSVLLPTLAFASIGVFLSVSTRSGLAGVLGPALLALAFQLISLLGPHEVVRTTLPMTSFDAWHGLFVEPSDARELLSGLLASTACIAIFLSSAWFVFARRDVSDAAPAGTTRRATLATGIGAAVLVAALVLASGLGSTRITATRLQAAITPTFERLVLLQYRLRTRQAPTQDVHVRSLCARSGSTGRDTGPGDDWACAVTVLRPQVKSAPVLTLDVTVRANACYTAHAPAAVTGPLRERDLNGRRFVNPLYAFDGCI